MSLSAILAATAFLNVAPVPTPLGELELAAVLRDAYHHETGAFPRRELLASAWAHVALETGRGRASIHHNLGAVGWTGGPFFRVAGQRLQVYPDFIDAARGYWTIVLRCSSAVRAFSDGDLVSAAGSLQRCGYHRSDVDGYARGLTSLRGAGMRAALAL